MNAISRMFSWCSQALAPVRGAGWPVVLGLCAAVLGLLMGAAAEYVAQQTRQLAQANQAASLSQVPGQGVANPASASTEFAWSVPAPHTHLDDMNRLFKLAKDSGVAVGAIVYRLEASSAAPILVRTLDLRLNEDYPKLKAFVAALLVAMPHLALQEIRVERKDATALQQQVLLKLSFFYQSDAKAPATVRGALP